MGEMHYTERSTKRYPRRHETSSDGLSEKVLLEFSSVLSSCNFFFLFSMILDLAYCVSFKICLKNQTKHGGRTMYEMMHKQPVQFPCET